MRCGDRKNPRYDHRLHGVLLVAQGMTCPEVAKLLGDARRSVEYWVRGFAEEGWAGLREGERGGRPRRLSEKQLQQVHAALRQRPRGLGGNRWDGKTLAAWIQRQYGDQFRSAAMSAFVPAVGFRFAPTAARHGPGGPGTAAPTHKKNSKR